MIRLAAMSESAGKVLEGVFGEANSSPKTSESKMKSSD